MVLCKNNILIKKIKKYYYFYKNHENHTFSKHQLSPRENVGTRGEFSSLGIIFMISQKTRFLVQRAENQKRAGKYENS